jgi:16S rRNA (uracil1498-N3)-methyltransferase
VPQVDEPGSLAEVLANAGVGARVLVLYEGGGEPLQDVVERGGGPHLLLVGPEGGFTDEEIAACLERGARLATLGPRILRFETAAIVGCALVQHLAGATGPVL